MIWHTVLGPGAVAIGSLESTPAHDGEVLTACAGDKVSLTCSHGNDAVRSTRWIFSDPVNCAETVDHNPPISTDPCGPFSFTNITEWTQGTDLFNSTAVAIANASMSGTIVECRDSGGGVFNQIGNITLCLLYTSASPRDATLSRMPSSA